MTPLALKLIAKVDALPIRLTGRWIDRISGEKVKVLDNDLNYIEAIWPEGFRHTFKRNEFLERFSEITNAESSHAGAATHEKH